MRYVRWRELKGMPAGIAEFLTEVSADGYVDRVVGLDAAGRVVHAKPASNFPKGQFGHFWAQVPAPVPMEPPRGTGWRSDR